MFATPTETSGIHGYIDLTDRHVSVMISGAGFGVGVGDGLPEGMGDAVGDPLAVGVGVASVGVGDSTIGDGDDVGVGVGAIRGRHTASRIAPTKRTTAAIAKRVAPNVLVRRS
jgi:hypothetical protein